MGRLIDADFILNKMRTTDAQPVTYSEHYAWDFATALLNNAPTVEAISKAEVKNISDNVLTIVREDYIHKADYENRLKADMVAMLTDIQLEIEELDPFGDEWSDSLDACNDIIQQKINALKAESEG